jgi:hypothetical protein
VVSKSTSALARPFWRDGMLAMSGVGMFICVCAEYSGIVGVDDAV